MPCLGTRPRRQLSHAPLSFRTHTQQGLPTTAPCPRSRSMAGPKTKTL